MSFLRLRKVCAWVEGYNSRGPVIIWIRYGIRDTAYSNNFPAKCLTTSLSFQSQLQARAPSCPKSSIKPRRPAPAMKPITSHTAPKQQVNSTLTVITVTTTMVSFESCNIYSIYLENSSLASRKIIINRTPSQQCPVKARQQETPRSPIRMIS